MVVMLSDGYGPVKAASSPPHPPPPKQDKWAAEIAKAVQRKGGDSQGADAVEKEIRQEEKQLAAKYSNDLDEKDTLATAGMLAFTRIMAQQAAQKIKDPTQLHQLSMQLMSQNLLAVAGNAQVTAADRARIERMLLDSNDTKRLGAGVAFLGQSLQVVDASHLSAADKAALEHTMLSSDYANSLGPGTAKFLHDFLGTLAKAQHDPRDKKAFVTATFDMYMVRIADQPQQASGAALDNELGQDLGWKPDRLQPCTAANPQGLANGKFELYSGKQLAALRQIAQQIHSVGGSNAKVTVLPVIFVPQGKAPPQPHVLCRVTGASGKTSYVSDEGRTYKNVRDFMDHNKLPFGKLYVAHDGHLSIDGNGQVQIDMHQKSKGVWDYTKQVGTDVGEGLAFAGGVVLTAALVIGSDGALLPVMGYAWAAVLGGGALSIAQGGGDLYDRSQRGQSVGLNRQTLGDYVNIVTGLLGPLGGAGQGMKTAAAAARATETVADSADVASGAGRTLGNRALSAGGRTLTGGAAVVNFGASAYSTQDTIRNWNNLSASDKIQGVLNTGMAVAGTAAHGANTVIDRRTAATTPTETVPAAAVTSDRNGLPIARSNGDDGDPAPLAATDGTARSGQAADEGGRPTGTARPDAVVPPGRSPVDGAAGTPARDIPVAEATSPRAPAPLPASLAGSPRTSSLTSPLTMEGAAAQERASQHDDVQRHNAESKHAQAEAGIRAADVRHGTARTVRLPPSGRTGTGRTDSARPGDGRPGTGRAGTGPGRVPPSRRNPPGDEVTAGITTAPETGPAAAAADGPTPAHPVPGETSQAQKPAGRSGSDATSEAGELQPPTTTAPMPNEVFAQAGRGGDQPQDPMPASGAAAPVEPTALPDGGGGRPSDPLAGSNPAASSEPGEPSAPSINASIVGSMRAGGVDVDRVLEVAAKVDDPTLRHELLSDGRVWRMLHNEGYELQALKHAWMVFRSAREASRRVSSSFGEYLFNSSAYSTTLGRPTPRPLGAVIANWADLEGAERTHSVFAAAEPRLAAALAGSEPVPGLNPETVEQLRKLLQTDVVGPGVTTFEGARSAVMGQANEIIGRTTENVAQLKAILALTKSSGSIGSIGERSVHYLLAHPLYVPGDGKGAGFGTTEMPELLGKGKWFIPDRVILAAGQTLEVKTGYAGGINIADQANNYQLLLEMSERDPEVAAKLGGPLEGHNWLLLPGADAATTPAQTVALEIYRQLGDEGLLDHQRVFYVDDTGTIRQVTDLETEQYAGKTIHEALGLEPPPF